MILNLMLGKQRGGLEQAVLDYAEAMQAAAIPALTVISPQSWIETSLVAAGVPHESLYNFAKWDLLAVLRLRRLAERTKARAVVCHGNRALLLALKALEGRIPIIAVAHNYSVRHFRRADVCFAITEHLATHLREAGVQHVHPLPNMVRITAPATRPAFRNPPVIGSMGRLVVKKGFVTFIEALAILQQRGIAFAALLGGDGDQHERLTSLIAGYGLQEKVRLMGWVKDKTAFFDAVDVFALPSKHEPFGIVLLEAMAQGIPVVTTDAEGPREIVHPEVDALMTPRGDAPAFADALARLIADAAFAHHMGEAGQRHVTETYSMHAMAHRLQTALAPYIIPL